MFNNKQELLDVKKENQSEQERKLGKPRGNKNISICYRYMVFCRCIS